MPLTGPSAPLEAGFDRSAGAERLVPETAQRRRMWLARAAGRARQNQPVGPGADRVALVKDRRSSLRRGRSAARRSRSERPEARFEGPPTALGVPQTIVYRPSSYLRAGLRPIVEQAPAALPGSGNSDPRNVSRETPPETVSRRPAGSLNDSQTIPGLPARTTRPPGSGRPSAGTLDNSFDRPAAACPDPSAHPATTPSAGPAMSPRRGLETTVEVKD
jgi:hypothetical protein